MNNYGNIGEMGRNAVVWLNCRLLMGETENIPTSKPQTWLGYFKFL